MKFKVLAQFLAQLEQTASRNQMTEILAQLFKRAEVEEIDQLSYLLLGQLQPKFKKQEFNLAEKMMLKAIARLTNQPLTEIETAFKQTGDLGKVVDKFPTVFKSKDLSINQVYESLMLVAQQEGEGSVERKLKQMATLLQGLDSLSARYVVRIPVNKLRLGFSDMTILDALSWMTAGDKSLRPELERAFNVSADIGKLVKVFKRQGLKGIKQVKAEVGTPIRPVLAERLPQADKIIAKLGQVATEPKYDGFRCQLHLDKTRIIENNQGLFKSQRPFIEIYSRNLDNTTQMFPDIVEAAEQLKVKQAIFDGEAVGFNPETGKMLPFQQTVQRKRKHGVKQTAKQIPLKLFVYDLLYLNGQALLDKPFKYRRQLLEKTLSADNPRIKLTEQRIIDKPAVLEKQVKAYLDQGLEGAMCKKLEAVYEAGARSSNWLKYKKTDTGLADTIDAVVMGYYKGQGKRTQFGIGKVLVGIRTATGQIKTVSKVGTGLTEKQLVKMKARCDQVRVKQPPQSFIVPKDLKPDYWCQPEVIIEIMADEISQSPIHSAGLALRFPRLVKFRDDKDLNQITSLKELKQIYKIQLR